MNWKDPILWIILATFAAVIVAVSLMPIPRCATMLAAKGGVC